MAEHEETFRPNWISPPGETIADLMNERNWTQVHLARRLGVSNKHLNHLLQGKVALTDEMAFRLAMVLGSTERFWLQREAQHRQQSASHESERRYRQWHSWLEQFPIPELKKAKILSNRRISEAAKTLFVEELLRFFSIASPEQWESSYVEMKARFRQSQIGDSNMGAKTAWLRLGEIEVENLRRDAYYGGQSAKYSASKFKAALRDIRELTVCDPEDFQEPMRKLCMDAGVYLIFVPAIPKARVSGVARWLDRRCPVIQLSLLGKWNDRFWFSFFHEAAHILLHCDKKEDIFLDDEFAVDSENRFEFEANEFADDHLIPPEFEVQLESLRTKHAVESFAAEIGIHPGIVVGRLQKENVISFSRFNDLKVRYEFVGE